mgnify:CR=1 FL=1
MDAVEVSGTVVAVVAEVEAAGVDVVVAVEERKETRNGCQSPSWVVL